jgi:hypothetical protein
MTIVLLGVTIGGLDYAEDGGTTRIYAMFCMFTAWIAWIAAVICRARQLRVTWSVLIVAGSVVILVLWIWGVLSLVDSLCLELQGGHDRSGNRRVVIWIRLLSGIGLILVARISERWLRRQCMRAAIRRAAIEASAKEPSDV